MKFISKFSGAMGLLLLISAFSQSGATARTLQSASSSPETIEARMAAIQEQLAQVKQDLAEEQANHGVSDAELLSQWYDWGDWVDWGDWGDWVDWGDWSDWGDWWNY